MYTKTERDLKQVYVFSPDLVNLYREVILREQKVLQGFIIGEYNCFTSWEATPKHGIQGN